MFAIVTLMAVADIPTLAAEIRLDRSAIRAELAATIPTTGALDRARLKAVLKAHRADLAYDEGARDTAEYLAGLFQISQWKARRWIEAAQALEALPFTAAALEAGALSLDKTVELCRFATPENEKELVTWARRVTMGSVRKRADVETKRALDDVVEVRSERRLEFTWCDDRLEFEGLLPPDEGARLVAAVDKLAQELPKTEEGTDPAPELAGVGGTLDQRRADALVLLATCGEEGSSAVPTFVVHTRLETLAGDERGCEVAGGPVLHPETARRLSCDARLQLALENKDGQPIGVGRESRNPPDSLRRQVFHRDGYVCTFRGCEMRDFLHPHHIQHWGRRGPTDLDNLVTVCTFHHTLLHEGRWSVTLENGKPIWFRPGGRAHDPGPAPPAHAPPPEKDPPSIAIAAGYSRLFTLINLMDPNWKPDPAASKRRSARARARLRARRLPDWVRDELEKISSN